MQFSKTIGHEKQKRLFERVVKAGRLAHAYVFVGEQGIGKTTFAIELAAVLGAHPSFDVFMLGQDEPVRVGDVRQLQTLLGLTPAGNYKAAIINADDLDAEAASALLKTLEEPPAHSLAFLTTKNFYSLLPTIASRVQKLTFAKASDEEVLSALADMSDDLRRQEIIKLASGRIGFARRLVSDEAFFEFAKSCQAQYQALYEPALSVRLKTAESVAALENAQVHYFLENSIRQFVNSPKEPQVAGRLMAALEDLAANVNFKLAVDNLFL